MTEILLQDALNDCLDLLSQGSTVDDCLRRYPQLAAQLRPMLEAGLLVRRARPTTGEVALAQDRVRFYLQQRMRQRPAPRPILRYVAGLIIALALAFGLVGIAAESSLPGDALYPIKQLTERLRLLLPNGVSLIQAFEQRRIDEVQQLRAAGRPAEVTFQGTLAQINGSTWQIGGIPVTVTGATALVQPLQPGDKVEVYGRTTEQGEVLALSIKPVEGRPPEGATHTATPSPTAALTASFTPSGTPATAPSSTPTATDTSAPTTISAPTNTSSPTPTASPSEMPSPTVTPTITPTMTRRATMTATASATTTTTAAPSLTSSPTSTATSTATLTATVTPSSTATATRVRISGRTRVPTQRPPGGGNQNDNGGGSPPGNDNGGGNDNGNDNDDDNDKSGKGGGDDD